MPEQDSLPVIPPQISPPGSQKPGGVWRLWGLAKKIWRRIENIVFTLLVLLIALYFVLQLPAVQNWLVGKVTSYLSTELKTTVRVDHVDIEFFDNIILEGVFVADQHGDTLLYVGSLKAGLNANIFTVLSNSLEFNELTLNDAKVHITRGEGEPYSNIRFLLDFFGGSKKPSGKPKLAFPIAIRRLFLSNIDLLQHDVVRGEHYRVVLPQGTIRINNLDIPSKIADIESIDLTGIYIDYEDLERKPLAVAIAAPVADTSGIKPPSSPFQFRIGKIMLSGGQFDMDRYRISPEKETLPHVMDFNHLHLNGINIQADSIHFDDNYMVRGTLVHLAATEESGFELKHAAASKIEACDTMMTLLQAQILVGSSELEADTFRFKYKTYKDFRKFNNQVTMMAAINPGSHIRLGDLTYFKDALSKNGFFSRNGNLDAVISGNLNGTVNNLKGRNLVIKIGNETYVEGGFDGNDLGRSPDIMRLSFKFDRLQSNIAALREIVPGFNPSKTFERLGNINYVGNYQFLFGTNHVLDGKIQTSIGNGDLDMQLDMANGREKAQYSGQLEMSQFDLKAWTGNKDFGPTSFHLDIEKGSKGLTLSSLRATVNGVVDTFFYKGYKYRNIQTNGTFSEKLFDGKLGVTDPNIDFEFDGTVNLKDSIPVYNFSAKLKLLNLGKLNLVDDDLIVSATIPQVRLSGRTFNDINGIASIRDIRILQDMEDHEILHRIDSLRFESASTSNGLRRFAIRSDVLVANIDGNFNLNTAPRNLIRLFSQYFPVYAAQLNLPAYDSVRVEDQYRFGLFISNTRDLTKLFDTNLDTLRNISLGGMVDGTRGVTELYTNVPRFKYAGFVGENLSLNWRNEHQNIRFSFDLPRTLISGSYKLSPIRLSAYTQNNDLRFALQAQDTSAMVKSVDLNGILAVVDSAWQIKFNNSNLDLFNQNWLISENNKVTFGRGYVITQDFDLMNEQNNNRRILLDSLNEGRGLKLSLSNFDLNFLNEILPRRGLIYRGRLQDFDISVGDIFQMKNIVLNLSTDTVFLNSQPYGRVDGNATMTTLSDPLEWNLSSIDKNFRLVTNGACLLKGDIARMSSNDVGVIQPGEFVTKAKADNFPLSILQQFIPGISQTAGDFDLDVQVGGKLGKKANIGMDGRAKINTGEFQINYLKTKYHIQNQPITLSNYQIWADGDTIYDNQVRRRAAIIQGGLRHNFFRDWRIDCTVTSVKGEECLLLNTTKADNPLYYGTGIGAFEAKFSGTFSRTDIKITATTGNNTRLFIPLADASEIKEANFIKFKPKLPPVPPNGQAATNTGTKKIEKRFQQGDLKGLSLEMNLTMTDKAEVQMIFDEQAGDIMKGRGDGNIALIINREGEFKMYGNYKFRKGEYLFTLLNFVNKPFAVADGGTIVWYGDPYGAQIDIDATYEENTAPYNLLRDELSLANPSLLTEAGNPARVIVTMHLAGDLFKPRIDFDLDFPSVSSQLKTFTDSKLRVLRQDPNEMSRQVFGLVVLGSFLLPDNYGANYGNEVFNTVTQMITSQLSNYLSGLASEWFGGRVSDIDFDIAYNNFSSSSDPTNPLQNNGRDLQLRMRSSFANDRITFQVGSEFGTSNTVTTSNNYLGHDVIVEIQPNPNRQWKVKIYERQEPDPSVTGNFRTRFGAGISFRREYDSFEEMIKSVGGVLRRKGSGGLPLAPVK